MNVKHSRKLKRKKILVLIVAYNAEKTIVHLLERISNKVLGIVDKIILADDASVDSTSFLAEQYKLKHKMKKLEIVKHSRNKGYGGNQKWGYNYAIANGFDAVVMIHGDAQYPPEYVPQLIKPIVEGKKDFMFGSRMSGHPLKGRMPLYKFFGNIFLTTTENLFLGTNLSEFHSGFRAYSVSALKKIPFNLNSEGFHFDSEIIFQIVAGGGEIGEVTIPTFYGNEKCNVKVISYGLNVLKELSKYLLNKLRLKKCRKYYLAENKLLSERKYNNL